MPLLFLLSFASFAILCDLCVNAPMAAFRPLRVLMHTAEKERDRIVRSPFS